MQGPFKVLRPLILAEQQRRDAVIRLRPVSAKGDKDQRIRSYLQPEFERGAIYAVKSAEAAIRGEMQVFPDGHQKDVLDMLALAIAASVKPREHGDEDDEDDVTAMKRKAHVGVSPVTGY
jgi:phage terminase large subunit-like protein